MKITLPASQAKKAAVLESLVSNPRPRKQLEKRRVVTTPEEQSEVVTLKGLAFGISSRLDKVKGSRSVKREQHLLHLNLWLLEKIFRSPELKDP